MRKVLNKIGLVFAFCFVFGLMGAEVLAQGQINYAEIRVDELSDSQIRQLILQAEAMGASDAQVLTQAQARGMKATEVEKLRRRLEQVRLKEGSTFAYKMGEDNSGKGFDPRRYRDPDMSDSLEHSLDSSDDDTVAHHLNQTTHADPFLALRPQIFGASLFQGSKLKFEPNLQIPTPRQYIIGPSDELLIDLMGDNEQHYEVNVGPDGYIRVEYVGLIAVGGLTIEQATSKLRQSLSAVYPGLRTGKTSLVVNLGNIRSIQVVLSGEVVQPGSYTLPSLASVFHALYAAGGPNDKGSYRAIRVIRDREIIAEVDLYDFLLHGMNAAHLNLKDQDIIHIPVYQQRVEITGEVKRSALFEVRDGENLQDVLGFAGGFNERAYTERIRILRNTSAEKQILDVAHADFGGFIAQDGDRIQVDAILDRFANRVRIRGAVYRPGDYALEEGMTLGHLIRKASGLREDAFLSRGYIHRLNPDNSRALLAIDIQSINQGDKADIPLMREDEVVIHSLFDLREEQKVSIHGEIRFPGEFDFGTQMSIADLVQMAGGFREGATPSRIEVSRRVRNSDARSATAPIAETHVLDIDHQLRITDNDFKLEPFDIVYIRSAAGYISQRQVRIAGEVLYPGSYTINHKDERLSDLIARAGGLTSAAYTDGASLQRFRDQEERHLVGIDLTAVLAKPGIRQDLLLEEGDIIYIPKLLQTVRVSGEVLNPNGIIYEPGKSLRSYIQGAGGFKTTAQKKKVFIRYANGSAQSAKSFLFFKSYPKVEPGSEIVVPLKPARDVLSPQSWVAISSTMASLTAIIVTLFR